MGPENLTMEICPSEVRRSWKIGLAQRLAFPGPHFDIGEPEPRFMLRTKSPTELHNNNEALLLLLLY